MDMDKYLAHYKTPEEEELARKTEDLEILLGQVAQNELNLATMQGELRAFEQKYLRTVGIRIVELDEIEAEIEDFRAERKPRNQAARIRAKHARDRAEQSSEAHASAIDSAQPERFEPSPQLKRAFRDLARMIHPDLAIREEEIQHRTQLMAEANKAYQTGDLPRLQGIYHSWRSAPETVDGEGTALDLVRVIRRIAQAEERLGATEQEMRILGESDLCRLRLEVEDAESLGYDLLDDMAAELDARLAVARQQMNNIRQLGVET